jgi:hypothetical protein
MRASHALVLCSTWAARATPRPTPPRYFACTQTTRGVSIWSPSSPTENAGRPTRRTRSTPSTALLDPVPLEYLRYRPQLLMLGGMAHHALQQGGKAKPYLEGVLRVQSTHPVAKVLASIHIADKNVDRAIEVLEQYLARRAD